MKSSKLFAPKNHNKVRFNEWRPSVCYIMSENTLKTKKIANRSGRFVRVILWCISMIVQNWSKFWKSGPSEYTRPSFIMPGHQKEKHGSATVSIWNFHFQNLRSTEAHSQKFPLPKWIPLRRSWCALLSNKTYRLWRLFRKLYAIRILLKLVLICPKQTICIDEYQQFVVNNWLEINFSQAIFELNSSGQIRIFWL